MRRVALKGLLGRRLRTILTALAIVIGIGMISGTLVLTDTINRAFHSILSTSYAGTDAVVSGKKLVDWSTGGNATIPESVLARVRALPDVRAATGAIFDLSSSSDTARLLDREGKVISSGTNLGFGIDPAAGRFNPFRLTEGRWAVAPNELVLDAETAAGHHFGPGDSIRVSADGPIRTYRVVGVAKFGEVSTLGGATFAVFTVRAAQALFHKQGYDMIAVAAKPAVSAAGLVAALRKIVPANAQVNTGSTQARDEEKDVAGFLTFVRVFLLVFGGIALFVGAFVIFNTFSITVAQRTREFATLRTLGASRRQVLRSVLLESLLIGFGASLIGLALGVGLAKGLSAAMSAFGLALPQTSLVFGLRTVLVSLSVGVIVTLLAGLVPAVRATRVPPIAAVREGSLPAGSGRRSQLVGLVLAAVGAGLLVYSALSAANPIAVVAGCLFLFIGVGASAARFVPGIVGIVGRPVAALGGTAGRLAQRNAVRSPTRTATAAAALMIGLALVTLFAVLAQGLRGSDRRAVEEQVSADFVVKADGDPGTLPTSVAGALGSTGATVSAVRFDRGRVGTSNLSVNGVDGRITRVMHFNWTEGSDATITSLARDDVVIQRPFASSHHLKIGDRFILRTAAGRPLRLRVAGIYAPPKLDQVLDGLTISQATFDRAFPRPQDRYVFVNGHATRQNITRALAGYPAAQIFTREGFIRDRSAFVGQFLNLVYVLLALAIVVSLFGMVNTLVLSVFERTRELGMLRAVGMTRRQARRMVRDESVITALIGAAIGLPLGLALAALVTRRISDYGVRYQIPVVAIAVFVAIALVVGLLAALLPARRISRLNILAALQYE
jgi:putative ABC transport system permease protein